jgi:L-fuconate dehydratase
MRITSVTARDVRARTSRTLAGSDALHTDPDYSVVYVSVGTDEGLEGFGFTFTLGRGNEVCRAAVEGLAHHLQGRHLHDLAADLGAFWRQIAMDGQYRWLGPEKGVVHLAAAALNNAIWDLWARSEGKPAWKLVADLEPEHYLASTDLSYLSGALPASEALDLLKDRASGKAEREATLLAEGYPAYITSVGWLGYSEERVRELCRAAVAEGWTSFKTKVGLDPVADARRCEVIREEIGWDRQLMIDANQAWEVDEAIERIRALERFDLRWVEEPTSPDDVLGHAAIRDAVAPVRIATGEHAHNRVMLKQFLQAGGLDYLQFDPCRLGGMSEVLAVLLLAARHEVPVCPHAGGLGLCEVVQHVSMLDFVAVSGTMHDRTTEFADHLHEHFVDPIRMRGGRYLAPEAPGFSTEMHPESLERMTYPSGQDWRDRGA